MWKLATSSSRSMNDPKQNHDGSKQPASQLQPSSLKISQDAGEDSKVSTHSAAPGQGGGSHRSISPEFEVNAVTGTMGLALPIYTSPGRSDFGPKLTLNYDSGSGNGPFGVGWSMSPPSISRKTSKGIPRYDDRDTFVLSSSDDLSPVKDSGTTQRQIAEYGGCKYIVERYRPRVETDVSCIQRWTMIDDANEVHWRVVNGENQTTFFGETDESRIADCGSDGSRKRIFSWLPSRSVDSFGNAVYFHYKAENSQGIDRSEAAEMICEMNRPAESRNRMRYLKRILYGNRTSSRDMNTWKIDFPSNSKGHDCMFEVVFDYGDHDDKIPTSDEQREWTLREHPFSVRTSGFELRTYRICRRILMFHRFPNVIGREFALVRSTDIEYTNARGVTLLRSFQVTGYLPSEKIEETHKETIPPLEFDYTESPQQLAFAIKDLPADALAQVSGFSANLETHWVDLDGEGAPGTLLTIEGGAWWYQRNEMLNNLFVSSSDGSAESFGPLKELCIRPNASANKNHYFEDLSHNGQLNLVVHDGNGSVQGYFERTKESQWESFRPFAAIPPVSLTNGNTKRIDLTGDGLQDILHQEESGQLLWYPCLAKDGFGPGQKVASSQDLPQLISYDPATGIYLADMTGDGMADIVEVKPGMISYWPNLGYGRFGSRITMGQSPNFDQVDQFSQTRVYLADICGSGTTDLIYLPPGGGVDVYFNQAGNSWSKRTVIPDFPAMDNTSSVFTLDLFGNGTSCLCWSGSVASSKGYKTLRYIDLAGGVKPYLMSGYINGMGATTSISYQASTRYYLRDEKNGMPWVTRLPFPVQCVSKVVVNDCIAETRKTTRYAYHDGYFDGVEREFRGFGVVEYWDDEQFGATSSVYLQRPPIRRKEWYHTGVIYHEMKYDGACHTKISRHRLPEDLSIKEHHDVYRALKGRKLREELYSEDGSELSTVPYLVNRSSYQVQRIQSTTETEIGIYRVDPLETVKTIYERQTENPKVEREIFLEVNNYGDVLRSLRVTHGIEKSLLPDSDDRRMQEMSRGVFTDNLYTDPVDETSFCFQKPRLASTRKYAFTSLDDSSIEDVDTLRFNDCAFLFNMEDLPYSDLDSGKISRSCKSLIQETRNYYLNAKLSEPLALGQAEAFSVLDQTYELVFTKDFLSENLIVSDLLDGNVLKPSMEMAGYICLDKDHRWWKPSERKCFSTDPKQNLVEARRSFYTPTVTINPFGKTYTTVMDSENYLVKETIDPMRNRVRFENCYWHLQPWEVTDINGNRTQSAFDGFGSVVGTARLGKLHEDVGDSLEGFLASVSNEDLEAFLQNPTGPLSRILLGRAKERRIIYSGRFHKHKCLGRIVPTFTAVITSDLHFRDRSASSNIYVSITYMDGQGAPLQTTTLCHADTTHSKQQWRISEWLIKDSKGNPVRICQPSYATDHHFQFEANIDSPKTTKLLDPLDRVVGVLYADHTWSKVRIKPWHKIDYDVGSTINIQNPTEDDDVGDFFKSLPTSEYLPTWLQHPERVGKVDIARQCDAYAGKHSISHFDSRGNVFLTEIVMENAQALKTRTEYDFAGHPINHYDALQRLVQQKKHDLTGRSMVTKTMDASDKTVLFDCMDKPLLNWDGRSTRFRHVYDCLQREREMWMTNYENSIKKEALVHKITYDSLDRPGHDNSNFNGNISCIEDQAGRLESLCFDFKGNCLQQSYTMASNYKSVIDWSESVSLDATQYICAAKFNAFDKEIESIDPYESVTARTYDLAGNLQSVSVCTPLEPVPKYLVSSMAYTPDELVLTTTYGNGTELRNQYDERSRRKVQATLVRNDSTRGKIQDYHFRHDCIGRIVQKWETVQPAKFFRNNKISPEWTYAYDALGRLVEATGREQVETRGENGFRPRPHQPQRISGLGDAMCQYREIYRYDVVGNILSMHHETPSHPSVSGWTRRYEYAERSNLQPSLLGNKMSQTTIGGKLERYLYEDPHAREQGCITSMAGFTSLTWDHMSQLRSSARQKSQHGTGERTWYVYNLAGARVRKITERAGMSGKEATCKTAKWKESVFLPGVDIYRKFTSEGAKLNWERTENHIAATSTIAVLERKTSNSSNSPLIRYQAGEGLELDSQGRFISHEEYSPFGSTVLSCTRRNHSGGQAPRKYRFAAYERDQETGLYYCHHRYYAPWLGRWLSPDPLDMVDGPNLFCYVANDPVNYVDPTGTCRTTDDTTLEAKVKELSEKLAAAETKIQKLEEQNSKLKDDKINLQEKYINLQTQLSNQSQTAEQKFTEGFERIAKTMKEGLQEIKQPLVDMSGTLKEVKTGTDAVAANVNKVSDKVADTTKPSWKGFGYSVGLLAIGAAFAVVAQVSMAFKGPSYPVKLEQSAADPFYVQNVLSTNSSVNDAAANLSITCTTGNSSQNNGFRNMSMPDYPLVADYANNTLLANVTENPVQNKKAPPVFLAQDPRT